MIGVNPSIVSKKLLNGYAMFSPIRDDMLRTYHTVPQVITFFRAHKKSRENMLNYNNHYDLFPVKIKSSFFTLTYKAL